MKKRAISRLRAFRLFLKTSKYGSLAIFLAIIILGGLTVWAVVPGEKIETLEAYPAKAVSGDNEDFGSGAGWSNLNNALGRPDALSNGKIENFSDANSATYKAGSSNLIVSNFLEEERNASGYYENKNFLSAKIKFSFATGEKKADLEIRGNENLFAIQNAKADENKENFIDSAEDEIISASPEAVSNFNDAGNLPNIDAKIIVWYSLDGEIWWKLDTISGYYLSNALNGGYFSFDTPLIKNWDDIKNLKIKFEGVVGGETAAVSYLDSVWVEVSYKGSEKDNADIEEKKSEIDANSEEEIKSISDKKDFKRGEEPELKFHYQKKQGIIAAVGEVLGINSNEEKIKTAAKIINPKGETEEASPEEIIENNGNISVKFKKDRAFQPGLYKVILEVDDQGAKKEITRDFTWGVLAINTNKSVYLPEEKTYIQMGVLNDDGHTICDASLKSEIRNPKSETKILTTEDGTIERSGKCSGDNVTDVPDYFAHYQVGEAGIYEMILTRINPATNEKISEITDSFEVKNFVPFEVERIGPTRIWPMAPYEMAMKIEANQDFSGEIAETVPEGFIINDQFPISNFQSISNDSNSKQLIWKVDFKSGENYELKYTFDAPDISPYIYLLGPLGFQDSGGALAFKEARQWQIAADAANDLILLWDTANGAVPSGWTSISDSGGAYYQKFIRGAATAGGTGGNATHTHTVTDSVSTASADSGYKAASGSVPATNAGSHTHTATIGGLSGSNEPSYRTLKVIRSSGMPATIPANIIALFDAAPGSSWTQYSSENGYFVKGEATAGTTGGNANNQHNHTVTISLGGPSATAKAGTTANVATSTHSHSVSNQTTNTVTYQPPYRDVVLYYNNTGGAIAIPEGLIGMFDAAAPSNWSSVSGTGGAFENKFIKAAATYGGTGGGGAHAHNDITGITSGVSDSNAVTSGAAGTSGTMSTGHTHTLTLTSFSTITEANNLPPYVDTVIAKYSPAIFTQNKYRFYQNENALKPTVAYAAENTRIGGISSTTVVRIRMNFTTTGGGVSANDRAFKLQYASAGQGVSASACSAIADASWADVGAVGSGTIWRGYTNGSVTDGTALSGDPPTGGDLLISDSNRSGTYESANNSATNPFAISVNDKTEYDWVIQNNSAAASTYYCFRMIESTGTKFNSYTNYPRLATLNPAANFEQHQWATVNDSEAVVSGEDATRSGVWTGDTVRLRIMNKDSGNKISAGRARIKYYTSFTDFNADTNGKYAPNAGLGVPESSPFDKWEFLNNCSGTWCDHGNSITTVRTSDHSPVAGKSFEQSVAQGDAWMWDWDNSGTSSGPENNFSLKYIGADVNANYFFRVELDGTLLGFSSMHYGAAKAVMVTTAAASQVSANPAITMPVANQDIKSAVTVAGTGVAGSSILVEVHNHAANPAALGSNTTTVAGDGTWTVNVTYTEPAAGTSLYVHAWQTESGKLASAPADVLVYQRANYTIAQSAYRWFNNVDSTDVGTVLANQDTAATAPAQGTKFRLRILFHVGTAQVDASRLALKLQYAQKSGTCDTAYSGESYGDVFASSGAIRYADNTPADGVALTTNTNDPKHNGDPGDPIVNQTYEEANNFTNSQGAIPSGQDGKWDFVLVDNSAPGSTAYCFRAVRTDGTTLDTPSVIPEITTATPVGITVSGNAYADEGTTVWAGCNGTDARISLVVNGGTAQTTSCNGGTGAYSFSNVTVALNNPVSVFFNTAGANTDKGVVATIAKDATTAITVNPRKNIVWVTAENSATSVTNANLNHCDSDGPAQCANVPYAVDVSSNLTVADGAELHIETSKTFAPAGTVTTSPSSVVGDRDGDIHIAGTFSVGTYAVSVGGDWNNVGTFSKTNPQTTTFTATGTGFNINTGGSNFNNIVFNGASGGWTAITNTFTVDGTLTITAGNFDTGAVANAITGATGVTGTLTHSSATGAKTFTGDVTINAGGVWNETAAAAINFGGSLTNNATTWTGSTGTHTFTGTTKTISGSTIITIPNISVSGTVTNSGTMTVSTTLAGAGGFTNGNGVAGTLNFGGASIGVTTFTASAASNTVVYNGASATSVRAATYDTLTVGAANSANVAYTALGNITANNNINLQSAALTYVNTFDLDNYNLTVGSASIANSGGISVPIRSTFNQDGGTATVKSSAAGSATIGGLGTTTFWNFTVGTASDNTTYNFNLGGAIAVSNDLTVTSGGAGTHTLDVTASNYGLTVGGSWTNNSTFTKQGGTVTFGSGWSYKKALVLSGVNLTDYQVKFTVYQGNGTDDNATNTVYCNGKCRVAAASPNGYGDIRFTDSSGNQLSYWIEDSAASPAIIWVKVSSIVSGGTTIYMLYGNSSATTTSNGDNTFILFDNGTSTAGWNSPHSSWVIDTGRLKNNGTASHFARKSIGINDYILEGLMQTPSAVSQYIFIYGRKADTDTDTGANVVAGLGGSGALYSMWKGDGWVTSGAASSIQTNTWYAVKLVLNGTNAEFFADTGQTNATTSRLSTSTASVTTGATSGWISSDVANHLFDDFRVRQYAATEPTKAWGSETVRTIADGGSPFFNIIFNDSGSGAVWLYQDGASAAPNQTTVQNGTPTYLNAKTGTVSVTGGTLNVDWYLGVHAVDAANTATDIDTAANDITISENSGTPASTVWKYDGTSWGSGATSQTTDTAASGKNPQPAAAGAIRIREYSKTSAAIAYYSYNLKINWVLQGGTNYGEYDYYADYGGNYLTSSANPAAGDKTISVSWYRSASGTMNGLKEYDGVNNPPTQGSWYPGMLNGLSFSIDSFSVNFGNIDPGANPSDAANTLTVSTSATNGYVITAWSSAAMICSDAGACGTAAIADWGGTNASPVTWPAGSYGFGYSTNDITLTGGTANRFSGPNFAGFVHSGAGDPVADRSNTECPCNNQTNTITYRIAAGATQRPGPYSATIIYVLTAQY